MSEADRVLCDICGRPGISQLDASARLISVATDSALRQCIIALRGMKKSPPSPSDHMCQIVKAENAILDAAIEKIEEMK